MDSRYENDRAFNAAKEIINSHLPNEENAFSHLGIKGSRLVDVQRSTLTELSDKLDKTEKSILTGSNRIRKLQTTFKAVQYAIENYRDSDLNNVMIEESLIKDFEEALAPTVELKLHCMDVRQLHLCGA